MSPELEVQIRRSRVVVRQGRKALLEAPLHAVADQIVRASDRAPSCPVYPKGVRLWLERRDATAVMVEVPAHARTVRWITDESPRPFGPGAKYQEYFLGFPYIVLLVVFRRGALTGLQQLYYRRDSLDVGEALCLPNLCNVAKGYEQRCWVCLQSLRHLSELSWPKKIQAIVDHVFTAAFNRSAEIHEGNSYWSAMRGIDPRVASLDAWQESTRSNPLFAPEVAWKLAGAEARRELLAMLNRVVAPSVLRTTHDLCGLITAAGTPSEGP